MIPVEDAQGPLPRGIARLQYVQGIGELGRRHPLVLSSLGEITPNQMFAPPIRPSIEQSEREPLLGERRRRVTWHLWRQRRQPRPREIFLVVLKNAYRLRPTAGVQRQLARVDVFPLGRQKDLNGAHTSPHSLRNFLADKELP